eukprot:CAMPEP_0117420414 /NCGR_PEP_ID=MMETSP0758-20121206/1747_1 /TAXON_ID=63605 /ORGANISM="Percolomonas cosmopolitus, Strain AE-1 (ATCC 50343)" /LENGTH=720 /DNA_ID=CAMNT_0005201997 /DNA_START=1026 /DNA_END=3185 /DNA_ORIENTATION=+
MNSYMNGFGAAISQIESHSSLTISNSLFQQNSAIRGGAIYISNDGDSLNIMGSLFSENSASSLSTSYGGAISIDVLGILNIKNSDFFKNKAESGGALSLIKIMLSKLLLNYGGISIINSQFKQNTATNGGAIHLSTEYIITLEECSFVENKALYDGGAIEASGASIASNATTSQAITYVQENDYGKFFNLLRVPGFVIKNSQFYNNTAQRGGSISTFSTLIALKIFNCFFKKNSASLEGGSLSLMVRSIYIDHCFIHDSFSIDGGSIHIISVAKNIFYIKDSVLINTTSTYGSINIPENVVSTFENVHFENNAALSGGAIYTHSPVIINRCLFKKNTALEGGIIYQNELSSFVRVYSSTFLNNTASNGACIFSSSIGYNFTFINSNFTGNVASYGGTIYFNIKPTNDIHKVNALTTTSCIFQDHSTIAGGTFYFVKGRPNGLSLDFPMNSSSDGYGKYVASDPTSSKLQYIKKSDGSLVNPDEVEIYPGEPFSLRVLVTDDFSNNIVKFPGTSVVLSIQKENNDFIFANSLEIPISNTIEFSEVQVKSARYQHTKLLIRLTNLKFSIPPVEYSFFVNGCPIGLVSVDGFCKICPAGSYSMIFDSDRCNYECDNFICLGGNSIEYIKGFYVEINQNGILRAIACPTGHCHGGQFKFVSEGGSPFPFAKTLSSRSLLEANTSTQYSGADCVGAREGPLCASCLPGFSLWDGNCVKCDSANPW